MSDPYGYDTPEDEGVDLNYPGPRGHERIVKAPVSEQRLTQFDMRLRNIEESGAYNRYCAVCESEWVDAHGEHHLPGCPCDPANVVVSRAWLEAMCDTLYWDHDIEDWLHKCEACGCTWPAGNAKPRHYDTCPLYVETAP